MKIPETNKGEPDYYSEEFKVETKRQQWLLYRTIGVFVPSLFYYMKTKSILREF